jgi:hypothetical protein
MTAPAIRTRELSIGADREEGAPPRLGERRAARPGY